MNPTHSKSELLYVHIRRSLLSGRYLPGQRIDPATIASEHSTSPTPVRFALYRLVGEGLVADQARAGLHVPLPTELTLRDLYDWMQRLLQMACRMGATARRNGKPDPLARCDDPVKRTRHLFDAIAQGAGHRSLHEGVKRANDRLTPIRHAKQGLIEDPHEELSRLAGLWHERDVPGLEAAIHEYHARRQELVPRIVALLNERREEFPQ